MSDKPIAERLQVKNGRRLAVLQAPGEVDLAIGVGDARCEVAQADVVVLFAADRITLEQALPDTLHRMNGAAILWLAYPKLTSSLARDLSRDIIRALGPAYGLDTVAQVAIDEDWSALRMKRV